MTASTDERKCIESGLKGMAGFGLAGLFVSALQNSYYRHSHGAWGVFSRTGGTIGLFALLGAVYAGTECFVAKRRGTADAWNAAAAGCATGVAAGLRARNFGVMCGACVAMGGSLWAVEKTGGWWKVPMQSMTPEQREAFRHKTIVSPPPKNILEGEQ